MCVFTDESVRRHGAIVAPIDSLVFDAAVSMDLWGSVSPEGLPMAGVLLFSEFKNRLSPTNSLWK